TTSATKRVRYSRSRLISRSSWLRDEFNGFDFSLTHSTIRNCSEGGGTGTENCPYRVELRLVCKLTSAWLRANGQNAELFRSIWSHCGSCGLFTRKRTR